MIRNVVLIVSFFFALLPYHAYGIAPVVDESENYALFDEAQATDESPVLQSNYPSSNIDEELTPLAHDDTQHDIEHSAHLLDKIKGLQQEIQELRGQLEVQAHELKILQEQQLSYYKDLDARIGNPAGNQPLKPSTNPSLAPETLSTSNDTVNPVITPIIQNQASNPANEQISYLAAYDLVKKKQFDAAISHMKAFIKQYPNGGYTANAHYWLGELYLVKQDYPQAIQHFETVIKSFPTSSKAAASLLKTGYALSALGKTHEARQTLQNVIQQYPDTNTAQLAKEKLEHLN